MARQHITQLRKLRNLSQTALAEAAGLTSSEISRIECGYRDMSEPEAKAIAKALDVLPARIEPRLLKAFVPAGQAASSAPLKPVPVRPAATLEDDPANFHDLPDRRVLERGELGLAEYRAALEVALKRATQVLHTSRVPAATWRAWREFERVGQEKLRAG